LTTTAQGVKVAGQLEARMTAPRSLVTLVFLLLAACSARGSFTPAPADRANSVETSIFVGTTRTADNSKFGFGRADQLSFLQYDISIPENREPGELSWPPRTRAPDPSRDFLTASEIVFPSSQSFRAALAQKVRAENQTTAVVYVHGFNVNMAEGVYRFVQMHHDLQVPAIAVHYSWPSRGSALGYIHDRDSATFARRGLEELLDEVVGAGIREIIIVSHSLGASLTMETLRQMALARDSYGLNRVRSVMLIQPDIDVDVFRSQARDIGVLPQPFVIFGSSADRILNLSARISGAPERLGNLSDVTRIADLDVIYVDTKNFGAGSGHMNVATSPALISLFGGIDDIEKAFTADEKGRVGLFPGIVLTVRNATEVVLAPVVAIGDELDD
jgi:esterase/lipase superfamily enzyme